MSAFRDAIVQKLQATAGIVTAASGGIYPGWAPEGVSHPFISVMAQQAQRADHVFQGIADEDAVILVKAIDRSTSPKSVRDINALVRTALHRGSITITGYTSIGCLWMQDVEYSEEVDGQVYQHEGGLYSLIAVAS